MCTTRPLGSRAQCVTSATDRRAVQQSQFRWAQALPMPRRATPAIPLLVLPSDLPRNASPVARPSWYFLSLVVEMRAVPNTTQRSQLSQHRVARGKVTVNGGRRLATVSARLIATGTPILAPQDGIARSSADRAEMSTQYRP